MSSQATAYAEALIQSALEGWLEQLTTVQRSLRRSPELAAVLGDPNALPTDRESAIGRLLPATAAPEVARFVRLLAQRGDMGLLSEVVAHVREVVPALSHDEDAEVTSAMALSPDEREKLEARLRARYGEGLRIRYEVNPELLGGLLIRIGDQIMDYTVAARFNALRERIVG